MGSVLHFLPCLILGDIDIGSALLWSLVLIFLLVLLFGAIVYLKKWMAKDEGSESGKIGFTLGDLRRMHQAGQMSDEEYERARAQMIAATQRAAARDAELAAEAAKQRNAGGVTDVEAIRRRAKEHRERAGGQELPPSDGGSPPAEGESPGGSR